MTTTRTEEGDTRITREAVQWVHRLEARPGQETADQFAAWLKTSTLHLSAFLVQAELDERLRQAAAARASRQIEITAVPAVSFPPAVAVENGRPGRVWALAAAAVLLLGVWIFSSAQTSAYRTDAFPKVVQFSGGAYARVFPNTQLSERSIAGFSRVDVAHGGAEFHVRHRFWQRFRVRAGAALITATGTHFNVLLRADEGTGIYVGEGDVLVHGGFRNIRLRQGDSVDVSPTGVISNIQAAERAYVVAADRSAAQREWSNRTLAAIAEEINRRSRLPQIDVMGPARERRFRGDVSLDDPQAWVNALATYADLQMDRQPGKVTIRAAGLAP